MRLRFTILIFLFSFSSHADFTLVPRDPSEPLPEFKPEAQPPKQLSDIKNHNRFNGRNYPRPNENELIEFGLDDNKYLFRPSCAEADADAKDIAVWMKSRGESCIYEKPKPQDRLEKYENWCYTDFTKCLPKNILSYYGQANSLSGPNCFNAALMMAGLVPGLRYVSDDEISATLSSPLCRPVKGAVAPGDIGVILSKDLSNQKIEYAHAYLNVSDRIAFSKNGYGTSAGGFSGFTSGPYLLMSQAAVQKTYKVGQAQACPNDEGADPPSQRTCDNYSRYFRCQTFDDYFKTHNLPAGLTSIFQSLNTIENCISDFNTGNAKVLTVTVQRNILDSMRAITQYLEAHKTDLKEKDKSFATIFKLRVFSYYTQISNHGQPEFGGTISYDEDQKVFLAAMKKELEVLDPALLKAQNKE